MPTYEYACRACGEHFEVVQSFKDDALTTCPACQGELRKVFSAAGLIFKGSGWHAKDYAASTRGASQAASASSDTATSGDASSDGGNTSSGDSGTSSKSAESGSGKAASKASSPTSSSSSSTSSTEKKSA